MLGDRRRHEGESPSNRRRTRWTPARVAAPSASTSAPSLRRPAPGRRRGGGDVGGGARRRRRAPRWERRARISHERRHGVALDRGLGAAVAHIPPPRQRPSPSSSTYSRTDPSSRRRRHCPSRRSSCSISNGASTGAPRGRRRAALPGTSLRAATAGSARAAPPQHLLNDAATEGAPEARVSGRAASSAPRPVPSRTRRQFVVGADRSATEAASGTRRRHRRWPPLIA